MTKQCTCDAPDMKDCICLFDEDPNGGDGDDD